MNTRCPRMLDQVPAFCSMQISKTEFSERYSRLKPHQTETQKSETHNNEPRALGALRDRKDQTTIVDKIAAERLDPTLSRQTGFTMSQVVLVIP